MRGDQLGVLVPKRIVRRFTRLVLIVVCLFSFASVAAEVDKEGELTLSDATFETANNSHELKELKNQADALSFKPLEFVSEYIPHLSVSGAHYLAAEYQFINVNFSGNPFHFPSAFPQDYLSIDASWTIFDGFSAWHLYQSAKQQHAESNHQYANAEFQLGQRVRKSFYQALAAEEMLKVTAQNVSTLKDHLTIASAMLRSGMSTRFDVLRLEAQLEEANAEYLLAVDNASIARDELSQLMGLQLTDKRTLKGTLPIPDARSIVENLKFSIEKREDIKAQRAHDESASYQNKASDGFWFPKVSLFAQEFFYKFGSFYPSIILPNPTIQNAYFVGVRVGWNVFDGGASIARSQSAGYQAKAQQEALQKALVPLPFDFIKWKKRYLYYVILYKARIRTVEKAKESVRLAKIGLRAGVRTHTEVLDAETDWFRSNAQVIQSQLEAVETMIALENTLGHYLTKDKSS